MAVSGNDPLESLLNSIQVAFSPLQSNFRRVAKDFGDCFNVVVKNGAADGSKAEQVAAQLNVENSSRSLVINAGDWKEGKLPIKLFLGLFTEKCGSNNIYKYDSDYGRDKRVSLHLLKNGTNAKSDQLRFDLALSFVINGFLQAFLRPFKAEKMGIKNMRIKDSSSSDDSDMRVKVESRMLESKGWKVKEPKYLPFEHLVTFVFDRLNNFINLDVAMSDHECKGTDYEALTRDSGSTNGLFMNLNFARVGGVPSSLLGVTSIKDAGEECKGESFRRDESGDDSTERLFGRSIDSESGTVTVPPPVEISTDSVLKTALAGGISCTFSTFLMHPVDTVKTQVQASTLSFTEILAKLPQLGLRGLYMGSIPAIVGQFSSHALRTGICEATKVALINVAPSLPEIQVHSMASFLGTFLGTTMRIPCEVLKQRLQAGQFKHVGEALVGTWQQDGLGGFFRGTGMTLCRELPFYVFGSGLYAESKKAVQRLLGRELQPWETIAVGAISGGLTAVLTTPFDVIKTRMMIAVQGQPTTMSIVALSILRDEGPIGLFRGAVPRFFWVAPLGAINFAGYELLRKAMD